MIFPPRKIKTFWGTTTESTDYGPALPRETALTVAARSTHNGETCPACASPDVSIYTADGDAREDCADLLACGLCGLEDFPLTVEAAAILLDNRARANARPMCGEGAEKCGCHPNERCM